jgi:hypothetical protein
MKSDKIRALLMLIISVLLTVVSWYVAVYYEESIISLVPILAIMFIYCPAMIVSSYILTNGLTLRGFLGPMDYGYYEK